MEQPLRDRVAVVTGASRGIGKGIALELGAAGATVYVTGRTADEGQHRLPGSVTRTAEEVTALGGVGVGVALDHRDDEAVKALFDSVEVEHGRLDVLVNSAFIVTEQLHSRLPFWEAEISNWDDMIDVGTRSAYVASAFAARIMVTQRRGLIVNVSSSAAQEYGWQVAYGVGKCALDRITADTAIELRPHRVSVVSIWPGVVRTEFHEAGGHAGLPRSLDMQQSESPRFMGRAVLALATDVHVLERSGTAVPARDLALGYGFTDIDGRLPPGPLRGRKV